MSEFYSELSAIAKTARAIHERGWHGLPTTEDQDSPVNIDSMQKALSGLTEQYAHPGSPASRPDLEGQSSTEALAALYATVKLCTLCKLCKGRTMAVPGMGVLDPQVLVIGEGPGADEDRTGLPFVGAAGQYLDKWLEAIDLSRTTNCHIANVVKCRPPANRDPEPEEISSCTPYLRAQINILKPKALLVVGRVAAGYLLGHSVRMNEIRGMFYTFESVPWMATYHPAAVLRDSSLRKPVWQDLKAFKSRFFG